MTAPTRPAPGRRRVSTVPPQHGAWAFLALPVLTAAVVTPWSPILLLLLASWVVAYPASYFVLALQRERSARRPDPVPFIRPLAIWAAALLAFGLPLVALRPWLLWVALAYLASFAVNLGYAGRHDDRALGNDAVFIGQCTAMVPVTWAVAAGSASLALPDLATAPTRLWVLTVAVALILTGSTLHVKSLIRERSRPRFQAASRAFAAASLAASFALSAWWGLPSGLLLIAPFGWFLARSLAMRPPAPRPARIGMIELVGFVLLVACAALAQGVEST